MRAIDRILGREPAAAAPFSTRAFGTTREEAAVAAASTDSANTTGGSAPVAERDATGDKQLP